MATLWLFTPSSDSKYPPKIGGQITHINRTTLTLKNPWVTDSVFMAKLYTAMTLLLTSDLQKYQRQKANGNREAGLYTVYGGTSVALGSVLMLADGV